MKKLFCILCLLLVATFLFVACGEECQHRDADDDSLCDTCGESYTDDVDVVHTHTYGAWRVIAHATCGTSGLKTRTCACGASDDRTIAATGEHDFSEQEQTSTYLKSEASCKGPAEYYYKCTLCGGRSTNTYTVGENTTHALGEDHVCVFCKKAYIYFGEYPQTLKADDVTITQVRDSRGYFLGSDNAYYAKVTAVPCEDDYTFSTGDDVILGTVYYFKVEPILWRILWQSGNSALIFCDSIIENKAYSAVNSGDYSKSDVRLWLNEQFYQRAFTALEQELILTTLVDNSAESTGYADNPYACENTNDKIFLLSYSEVTNSEYGFSSKAADFDSARRMIVSDYCRAAGAFMIDGSAGELYAVGYWWLRSTYHNRYGDVVVRAIHCTGEAERVNLGFLASYGVVPAMRIRLN